MRFLLLALLSSALSLAQPAPQYEVFAIQYATIPDFRVSQLVAGAGKDRKLDISMMVWLVRGNGHNILVDSGFYREQFFRQWKVAGFTKPSESIARLGLKPEDITDVVISHMHWDHADGLDLFPKARIWIQKEELEYYAGSAWQSRATHGGIDPEDILALVKLNTQGRVGLELSALGIPSISISYGLNPIDDFRIPRVHTNRPLRARGLTPHLLSEHLDAILDRADVVPGGEADSDYGRLAASQRLLWHIRAASKTDPSRSIESDKLPEFHRPNGGTASTI